MNFNLAVILTETAAASPGKPVAVYDGGQMTYGELDAMSDRLGRRLGAGRAAPGGRGGAAAAQTLRSS